MRKIERGGRRERGERGIEREGGRRRRREAGWRGGGGRETDRQTDREAETETEKGENKSNSKISFTRIVVDVQSNLTRDRESGEGGRGGC